MSGASEEFLERVADVHEPGDRVDLHDGEADPLQLIVPPGTPAEDFHLFLQRAEHYGYEIAKEYTRGDEVTQATYLIHFPDERGGPA